MSNLPMDVTISYGDGTAAGTFTFPVETTLVGADSRPVEDSAGRTFTHIVHSLTVKTLIWVDPVGAPGARVDSKVAAIRNILLMPAGTLVFKAAGWGDFTINPQGIAGILPGNNGEYKDVAWGPKPRIVKWEQAGHNLAAWVTWTVEFSLATCPGGNVPGSILSFNYSLSTVEDRSGYSTRTYRATASIPMTRKTPRDRTLPDTADRLLERMMPTTPIGFRRGPITRDLSEDKRTLTLTVVDEQLPPNQLPPGVVFAEASHDMHAADWRNSLGLVKFIHNISATYELTSDRSRMEAWNHFALLVRQRKEVARKAGEKLIGPLSIKMSEPEIYGRRSASFSVSYAQIYPAGGAIGAAVAPKNIVAGSGLFTLPPENDWQKWYDSLKESKVFAPRGISGLRNDTREDVLLDMCSTNPVAVPTTRDLGTRRPPAIRVGADLGDERPDPEDSFLDYKLSLTTQVIDNVVSLKPLPTQAVGYSPTEPKATDTGGYRTDYTSGPCDIVQCRGSPTYVLTLEGSAIRVGYEISPPRLLKVGSVSAVPMNDETCGFRSWLAGNFGVPVVKAVWRFRYLLPCRPTQALATPPNPLFGSLGAASTRELKGFIGPAGR